MSNTYKNTAFWSWNADVKKDEALIQLADFKKKGYGGAFIHARGGLEIEYMGKEWFDVYDACVKWADENDFDIWIYDESGWPSGFGGGKVNGLGDDYRLKHLVASDRPLTDEGYKLEKECDLQGGKLYIYLYTDKNYVDLLDPKVTAAFIESTHEVYYARYKKYFGGVIKGLFTDEPQVFVFHPYSERIVGAFKEKYNIDFRAEMHKLFIDTPEREYLFYLYYSTVADLFTENYVKPVAAWCEKRGIAFTGHFAEEDGLMRQYRATGGVMRNYELMQQPGIDFLGRRLASPVLPKQLCSVKNQFDKETVLSETFGCSGWNVTFGQLVGIWGYQAAFGINKACLHLSAYTIRGTRKRDYPPFFSYQEPWWECFGAVSEEMERINRFISRGSQKNDVLLISALTSVYSQQYRSDRGKTVSAQFRQTVENLIAKQYPFDIGDERIMRDFAYATESGGLVVGKREYRFVIVPEAVNLEKSTWDILKKFCENGGKAMFINAVPKKCSGKDVPDGYSAVLSCPVVANRAGLIEKYFRAVGYRRKVKITDDADGRVCEGLVLNVTENDREINVFAQNVSSFSAVLGRLFVREYGRFYGQTESGTTIGTEGVYTHIEVPPSGNISVSLIKGETPVRIKEKFVSASALPLKSAKITADNCFNIDKAYFVIDGEKSGLTDTAVLQDEINRAVNLKGAGKKKADVVYTYTQTDTVGRLRVAAEIRSAKSVKFNGTDIKDRFGGWFMDKSILCADVADLQRKGKNELVISYEIYGQKSYADYFDGFETERNLFHYKSEAESVYITGDFSVGNENAVFDDGCITTGNGGFSIDPPQAVDFEKELTEQGLYFYRGAVEYRYPLVKAADERVIIRFDGFYGVAAKLSANGKEKVVIYTRSGTDVTDILEDGENELVVTLYGSNRNLLGPFHHKSGEPAFVGNSTFRGKKGFEDTILYDHFGEDTYDGNYHFVKFGLGSVIAEKRKRED